MNLLLTDMQAATGDGITQAVSTVAGSAAGQQEPAAFPNILRTKLNETVSAETADLKQVIDSTAVISDSVNGIEGAQVDLSAISGDTAQTGNAEVSIDTAEAVALLLQTATVADNPVQGQTPLELEVTEPMPAGGMNLPPVAAPTEDTESEASVAGVIASGAIDSQASPVVTAQIPASTSTAQTPKIAAATQAPTTTIIASNASAAGSGDSAALPQGNSGQVATQMSAGIPAAEGGIDLPGNENRNNFAQQLTQSANASASPVNPAPAALSSANASPSLLPLPADAAPTSLQSMSLGRGETSADIGNSLADRVQWMVNHRRNVAQIRLDPPLLGRLDVQVKVVDDVAMITIQTQQGMTRDMIDAASFRLREALQDSGFQSVQVDVSHREDPGHQAEQQDFEMTGQAEADDLTGDELAAAIASERWIDGYLVSGMVDTFA